MYKYHCLNPISNVGLKKLNENYEVVDNAKDADAILVRSAGMHEMEFSDNLKAIARAGAGVNNIPLENGLFHDFRAEYKKANDWFLFEVTWWNSNPSEQCFRYEKV